MWTILVKNSTSTVGVGEFKRSSTLKLFKQIWVEEAVPKNYNELRVVLLQKGGLRFRKFLSTFRLISLGITVAEIFCLMIYERLNLAVDGEGQNCFRQRRRGEEKILL